MPSEVASTMLRAPARSTGPLNALRGGIQKSVVTDFLGNVGDSRQMLTKTSQWLQERASDTPTKGLLWNTKPVNQEFPLSSTETHRCSLFTRKRGWGVWSGVSHFLSHIQEAYLEKTWALVCTPQPATRNSKCGIGDKTRETPDHTLHPRVRAKREQLQGLLSESQGQNLALTVLHVPNSVESGAHLTQAGKCP
jgi:hypothetical protein